MKNSHQKEGDDTKKRQKFKMSISSLFSSLSNETTAKIQTESSYNLYKKPINEEEIQKQQKLIEYFDSEIPQLQNKFNELHEENEHFHSIINEKTILHQWYSDFSNILQDLTETIERKNSEKAAINRQTRNLSASEENQIKEKVDEIFDFSSNETDPRQIEELEHECEYLQDLNKRVEEEISILKSVQGNWNPTDDFLHNSIDEFCHYYNIKNEDGTLKEACSLTDLSISTPFNDIEINEDKIETNDYERIDKNQIEQKIKSLTENDKIATTKLENIYFQQAESLKQLLIKMKRLNLSDIDLARYEENFLKRIRSMGHFEETQPLQMPTQYGIDESEDFINQMVSDFKQFLKENRIPSKEESLSQNQKEIENAKQILDKMSFDNLNITPHTLKQPFIDKNITKLTLSIQKLDQDLRSNIPKQEFEDISNLYQEITSTPPLPTFNSEINSRPESVTEISHDDFDFETEEIEESLKALTDELSQSASQKLPESLHSFFQNPELYPKNIAYLNEISKEKDNINKAYQIRCEEIQQDENNETEEKITEDPIIDLNVQMNALLKQMENFSIPPTPSIDLSSIDLNADQPPLEDQSNDLINAFDKMIDPNRYQALIAQELTGIYQNRINEIEPQNDEEKDDNTEAQLEELQKEYNELVTTLQKNDSDYNEYFSQIKEISQQITSSKEEMQQFTQEFNELQTQSNELSALQEQLNKEKADFDSEKEEKLLLKQMLQTKLSKKLKLAEVKNE